MIGCNDTEAFERFSYDSTSGTGTYLETVQEGSFLAYLDTVITNVDGIPTPAFTAEERSTTHYNQIMYSMRDSATGRLINVSVTPSQIRHYRPDGAFYITGEDSGGYTIFRSDTDAAVAHINRYGLWSGWDSIGVLWTHSGSTSQLDSTTFSLYDFDGSNVVRRGGFVGYFTEIATSSDAAFAALATHNSVDVYKLTRGASLGIRMDLISSIPFMNSSSSVFSLKFLDGYRLAINEGDLSGAINVRIYAISPTVALLRSFTEAGEGSLNSGVVSPKGSFVAITKATPTGDDRHPVGTIRIYRVSDGSIVRSWENQFLTNERDSWMKFSADEFVFSWTVNRLWIATVIPPTPISLSITPSSIPGGNSATATVVMNRVVNQDTVVHPSVSTGLVSVPAAVTIPSGSSSATFLVTTHGVVSTTVVPINCTYSGGMVSASLTLAPPTVLSVMLDKANIEGVGTTTGTITLNAAAPAGGLSVKVISSKTSSATVSSATVVIPSDSKTGTFTVTTKNSTADYLVTVTAKTPKLSGTVNLMVAGLKPLTLSLDKTTLTGGDTATLTITRSAAAPAGGLTYQLASDNASLVPPATMVLPAGQTTASVTVNTLPVASSTPGTITLSNSSQVKTISATVIPLVVVSLSSSPTEVTGNGSIDVTITLNGPASAGFSVTGASNAAAITVPASISIPAGQTSYALTLAVKKVTADRTVTIAIGGRTVTVTLHKP